MKKAIVGSVGAAALAGLLYSQGLLPFMKPNSGQAAPREATAVNGAAQRRDEPAPAITVVPATRMPITDSVLVTGTLVPRLEVLVAPEVEGLRVMELLVEEGDKVAKGQVLARLEQETLRAQLAQNEATLARTNAAIHQASSSIQVAEARNVEATNAYDRARPLKQSGVVSDSTLDQREAAARTAEAQLRMARDGLKLAEAERAQVEALRRDLEWRLSRTEVRATVDGIVSRRNARVGAVASGTAVAQPMFNIIARGQIELEAEVPEADLSRLKPDLAAVVSVPGTADVSGRVRLVMPEIDKTTRLGRVRIELADSSGLRIGSFGRGTVVLRKSEALTVPASAVLIGNEGAFVLVVAGNRVASRKVAVGLRLADLVEIKDGLAEGDVVVAKAGTFIRSGDLITPVDSRAAPSRLN